VQAIFPAFLPDEGFDFVTQQPIRRVAVHAGFPVLQPARPHGLIDFLLRQAKLLPSRLVLSVAPFCDQFGSMVRFSLSPAQLTICLGKLYKNGKFFHATYDSITLNKAVIVWKKYCSSLGEDIKKFVGGDVKETFTDPSDLIRLHRGTIGGEIP
jgi:hypothetical protein